MRLLRELVLGQGLGFGERLGSPLRFGLGEGLLQRVSQPLRLGFEAWIGGSARVKEGPGVGGLSHWTFRTRFEGRLNGGWSGRFGGRFPGGFGRGFCQSVGWGLREGVGSGNG